MANRRSLRARVTALPSASCDRRCFRGWCPRGRGTSVPGRIRTGPLPYRRAYGARGTSVSVVFAARATASGDQGKGTVSPRRQCAKRSS